MGEGTGGGEQDEGLLILLPFIPSHRGGREIFKEYV
jgi:hypothetical protein